MTPFAALFAARAIETMTRPRRPPRQAPRPRRRPIRSPR